MNTITFKNTDIEQEMAIHQTMAACESMLSSYGFLIETEDYDPAFVRHGDKNISVDIYDTHASLTFHHLYDEVTTCHTFLDLFMALIGNFDRDDLNPSLMLLFAMAKDK
jgi:hypothetical protein